MNKEFLQHCKNEIKYLLNENVIRPLKSPWSYSPFYVLTKLKGNVEYHV